MPMCTKKRREFLEKYMKKVSKYYNSSMIN